MKASMINMVNNYNKIKESTSQIPARPAPLGEGGGGGEPTRRKRPPPLPAIVPFIAVPLVVLIICNVGDSASSSTIEGGGQPSPAIVLACRQTRFPSLCIDSLVSFPGAQSAQKSDLVRISMNVTLQRVYRAHSFVSGLIGKSITGIGRQVLDDCLELLEDSVDQLSRSIAASTIHGKDAKNDVTTWLSAALTNHDTCLEGIAESSLGQVRDLVQTELGGLEEITSNSLAIYAGDLPLPNRRRRRLLSEDFRADEDGGIRVEEDGFPAWLSLGDRKLLSSETKDVLKSSSIQVAGDGSGGYQTIQEAINAVPDQSNTRTIIYVKAGRYQENIRVVKKKWNVMIVGAGKGVTVISGSRSNGGGYTTFDTATFAVSGMGFIARDITFENTAGPGRYQAVALRVGGDHAVIYRCAIVSYQDSLYVYSQRQFFRECDVYGTVDFICGNAAVVIQKSNIVARKPMGGQKNTITAQNRKDPNQNTGISIHQCNILASQDLNSVKSNVPTYLGRPWKQYSRVVYMLSNMGDHIHPAGWLPWMGNLYLDTLYYGEYMNYGPGAATGRRVQWRGHHIITNAADANKFTVGQFIYGASWLPSTGVAYSDGLS